MSTPLERKRAENVKAGDEAMVKAQKFTKKTLTRWKPDWESASRFYRDAVKAYKVGDDDEKTIQGCKESAVAHDELGQFLTAATDLETAAQLMAKESNKGDRQAAYDCYRESGLNYRKNNSYEKAAAMYVKAAETMEEKDQGLALEALKDACAIFEDEQRGQFHDATFKKAINSAVKYGKVDEAIAFMKRQNSLIKEQSLMSSFSSDVYKNYLQILVLLFQQGEVDQARDEFAAAEAANDKFPSSEQYPAAAALVEAYDDGDSEKLTEALKKTPFKYIANSVSRTCPPPAPIAPPLSLSPPLTVHSLLRVVPSTDRRHCAEAADEGGKEASEEEAIGTGQRRRRRGGGGREGRGRLHVRPRDRAALPLQHEELTPRRRAPLTASAHLICILRVHAADLLSYVEMLRCEATVGRHLLRVVRTLIE